MSVEGGGSFVLVLHGHMPWVLNHGRWPHGDHWLFDAVLDVYLPLLGVVDELAAKGLDAGFSLGLTPVLLEQLRAPGASEGLAAHLEARLTQARADQADPALAGLAAWWEVRFCRQREHLSELNHDVVSALAEHAKAGRIELLSSFAAHGFAPLLLHDASIRGQLRTGLDISERHLGFRPRGIWLPECAFRPAGAWTPPVLHGDSRQRRGVDQILADEGVTHFVVDHHLVARARSEAVHEGGGAQKVGWERAGQEPWRGWRSPMRPHRVNTEGGLDGPVAFARHPELSEQVWSADVGYPGDPTYLEFHKRHGGDGLRYWRVTDRTLDLGGKAPYDSRPVADVVYRHARHFADTVRDRLGAWRQETGRAGVVCAPFDAELFGHWWFEGPDFLREVLLALHHEPDVRVETAAARLARDPPDTTVWLPEGTWGEGGDHRVWLEPSSEWTWEAAYRAEDRFLGLLQQARAAPEGLATLRAWDLLRKAARELLMLQASDWNFVIHTGGAVDYGHRRFCDHLGRFDMICTMAADVLVGRSPADWELQAEALYDARCPAFADPPLDAWR